MRLFLAILFLTMGIYAAIGQTTDSSSAKNTIALLGTYHFSNPNQDQFNVNSDNVLSEKRQKEIEAMVNQLAKYKPTHIAVEFNANDTAMDNRYQRYLKGQHQLSDSELEQIGFRLAKKLGHAHLYPVDAPAIQLDFEPGTLANDYGWLLGELNVMGSSVINQINTLLKTQTIGQVLASMNTAEFDKLNVQLYYKYLLPIGKGDNQPGLEAVTRWYKRNLSIFHHIMKLTEGKKDQRVLVIFGQGHTAMLKQFLDYSSLYNVTSILPYLTK